MEQLFSYRLYSLPRLFNANGDLTKRWYVYYSYKSPHDYSFQRFRIYKGLAKTTKKARKEEADRIIEELKTQLESGWSPFEKLINTEESYTIDFNTSIETAINRVTNEKKKYLRESSYININQRNKHFIKWLKQRGLSTALPETITKSHISDYLNELDVSARTRDNYLIDVKSTFSKMEEMGLILFDFSNK